MKLRNSLLARSAVVLTVVGFTPLPAAAAQSAPSAAAVTASAAMTLQSRTRQGRGAQAAEPRTGPEVIAEAQAVLASTNTGCEVVNAVSPGRNGDINIYEVACSNGLGHILTDGPEPTTRNCFIVAQQSDDHARENPGAPEQVRCSLPENANPEQMIARYVQAAGITCQVEGSRWVGRTQAGEERYEVGCSGSDGYWLRANNAGEFEGSLECLEVTVAGGECQLTSRAEQLAGLQARFASVAPQSCTAEDARFVGANEQYRFYEVKCSEGFGFVGQTNPAGEVLEARDCSRPQIVPGGCTLTDSSAAQAAASEQRVAALRQVGRTCAVNEERIVAVESPPDGSPGREIYEFDCADQPFGLTGFFPPAGGSGEIEAFDCFTMDARGLECQFVARSAINTELTRMITASQRNCNVVDYRVVARMASLDGDVAEVKCDDGRGWFGEFPDDRQTAGQLLPCAAAARQGDECVL
ncbi:MAG: hypothetical protein ACK4FB_05335 [Brevundimonas sp.]|uniref:hypothetical protein n=1 Tax=Brevundimonas sp. TaxID=1871086 RepID=UPI00391CB2E1